MKTIDSYHPKESSDKSADKNAGRKRKKPPAEDERKKRYKDFSEQAPHLNS